MSGAYRVPYRVESLQTDLGITPACPEVVALFGRSPRDDRAGDFDVDKLNLVPITKMDNGQCLFACISMAVYGEERRHREIRKAVCDFIQHKIIPFYKTLDIGGKVSLMLQFGFVDEDPFDQRTFDDLTSQYIKDMRRSKICGTNLELSVACYVFRMEIMIIKKKTRCTSNKHSRTTYSRCDFRRGHRLMIEGMQPDGVGSMAAATPNKAAAIQSVVMMFCEYELVGNDKAAAGPALDAAQRQAVLLAEEAAYVGHYELMAVESDYARRGQSGSAKKVAKKSHPPDDAAGAGKGTSNEDKDDTEAQLEKLEEKIRAMKENEYGFVHNNKKMQKQYDDQFDDHTKVMQTSPDDITPEITEYNNHLRMKAAQFSQIVQEKADNNMHNISMAQAQLCEYQRHWQGIEDPDDTLFAADLERFQALAQKRYAANIELHKRNAAAPKIVAPRHDIAKEKDKMQAAKDKMQRSKTRVQDLQIKIKQVEATQLLLPTQFLDANIANMKINIARELDYQNALAEYEVGQDARLRYLEADNNGLGDEWIATNPVHFLKFGKQKP